MKFNRLIINFLVIFFISFTYACKKSNVIINAADFGLNQKEDATPAIRNAIEACKKQKAQKLIIPKGRYEFYPDKAFEIYVAVSNNDNGLKRVAFPVIEMQNFEIDANGSEFIFHGNMQVFEIKNSKNIHLTGFSIDWTRTFHSEAKVVAVNEKDKTFDIEISKEYPYSIHGNELIWEGEGWFQNIGQNLFWDPRTMGTVYHVNLYKLDPWNPWVEERYSAKELRKGLVRIHDTIAKLPFPGLVWVSKGHRNPSRLSSAIHCSNSFQINLDRIDIFHAGGMGFIADKSGDIHLSNFNVKLRKGSGRMVSTTADATHFVNCKGKISIDSCFFENMMDDATNVHGIYATFVDQIDEYTAGFKLNHVQQTGFLYAAEGDSIAIVQRKSFQKSGVLVVKKIDFINESYFQITFQSKIDKQINEQTAIENISWYPTFSMKNCTIQHNRARSVLISNGRSVNIEKCSFSSMMAAISIAGDANYWFESGACNLVTIRDNKFLNNCSSGHHQATIFINPEMPELKENQYYHKNFIIENNMFMEFDRLIIYAKSVEGLKVINNIFHKTVFYKPIFPNNSSIELVHCKDIVMERNKNLSDTIYTLKMDATSRKTFKENNNKNFKFD